MTELRDHTVILKSVDLMNQKISISIDETEVGFMLPSNEMSKDEIVAHAKECARMYLDNREAEERKASVDYSDILDMRLE